MIHQKSFRFCMFAYQTTNKSHILVNRYTEKTFCILVFQNPERDFIP